MTHQVVEKPEHMVGEQIMVTMVNVMVTMMVMVLMMVMVIVMNEYVNDCNENLRVRSLTASPCSSRTLGSQFKAHKMDHYCTNMRS